MSYSKTSEHDLVYLRTFPARTLFWISCLVSFGSGLFFVAFHLLAWAIGLPGPLLWFGSTSRLADVMEVVATLVTTGPIIAAFGIPVVKGLAMLSGIFNIKLRVR